MPFTGLFTNGHLKTLLTIISLVTAIVTSTLYFTNLDKESTVGDTTINGKIETLSQNNELEHKRIDGDLVEHKANRSAHDINGTLEKFVPRVEIDARLKAIESILIKQDDKLDKLLQRK